MSSSAKDTAISTDWQPLWGFYNPPPAPKGYKTEVELCGYMGFPISYRYVKVR